VHIFAKDLLDYVLFVLPIQKNALIFFSALAIFDPFDNVFHCIISKITLFLRNGIGIASV
jgi:hypothetical protein